MILYRTKVIEEEVEVNFPIYRIEENDDLFKSTHIKFTEKCTYTIELKMNSASISCSTDKLYFSSLLDYGEESSEEIFETALGIAQSILNHAKEDSFAKSIVIGEQIINAHLINNPQTPKQ